MNKLKNFDYFNSHINLIDDRGTPGSYVFERDSDFYNNYLLVIHEFKQFEPLEEIEYFKLYNETLDLDVKQEIIKHNLCLVPFVAKSFLNRGLEFEELVQEGNLGLIRAIESFDYSKGYKFSTYAYYHIRSFIVNAISEKSRTIRLPHYKTGIFKKLHNLYNEMALISGGYPSLEEFSLESGYSVDQINKIFNASRPVISINSEIHDHDEIYTLDEIITTGEDTEDVAVDNIISNDLTNVMSSALSEKECFVISNRYGFVDGECKTLDFIANKLGLTKEGVRYIENRALRKLKAELWWSYEYNHDVLKKELVK